LKELIKGESYVENMLALLVVAVFSFSFASFLHRKRCSQSDLHTGHEQPAMLAQIHPEPKLEPEPDLEQAAVDEDAATLAGLKARNSFHRGPGEDVKESLAVRSGRAYREKLLQERAARLEEEAREAEARALREAELLRWRSMTKGEQIQVWLDERIRPEPQPMGVSPRGAETLVSLWLSYLGEEDVHVTQASGDGGADVLTRNYCCQVKLYTRQAVSSSEIRDLFGTATAMGLKAIIMTSSYLTRDAEQFAGENGIVAIQFNVERGTLASLNALGGELLVMGHYTS
jgi:hypothetical protein